MHTRVSVILHSVAGCYLELRRNRRPEIANVISELEVVHQSTKALGD